MIFCPNYLVTPQVFEVLRIDDFAASDSNLLMKGDYGIAKTVSIVLFIHLSNFIHELRYKAKSNNSLFKEWIELT